MCKFLLATIAPLIVGQRGVLKKRLGRAEWSRRFVRIYQLFATAVAKRQFEFGNECYKQLSSGDLSSLTERRSPTVLVIGSVREP